MRQRTITIFTGTVINNDTCCIFDSSNHQVYPESGKQYIDTEFMQHVYLAFSCPFNIYSRLVCCETRRYCSRFSFRSFRFPVIYSFSWIGELILLVCCLQISRSIGDVYLKKAEFNREPLYQKFRLREPFKRPILSSDPSIAVQQLLPHDQFIIFASDGLWEHLTNQEAVDLVQSHPRSVRYYLTFKILNTDSNLLCCRDFVWKMWSDCSLMCLSFSIIPLY